MFGPGDPDSEDLGEPGIGGLFGEAGVDEYFFRGGGSGAASPSKLAGSSSLGLEQKPHAEAPVSRRILWPGFTGVSGDPGPACSSLTPGALRLRMGGASGFMCAIIPRGRRTRALGQTGERGA